MWILILAIAIIGLYLFLVLPALRKHPDARFCNSLYVAHRGLHDISKGIPENSMLSFKNAISHSFAIEIDIHITKDDKVVIFHDDNLQRVCGEKGIIEQMTYEQLSGFKLSGTDEKIPLLEQLLEICKEDTILVIEYKCSPRNYLKLCKTADKILSKYNVKYIVQSFNPLAMRWYKKNRPEISRGQLSTNFAKEKSKSAIEIILGFLLLNFLSRPDFISYEAKYFDSLPRRLCILTGAIPAAWTIRSQSELESVKDKSRIYIFENFIPEI